MSKILLFLAWQGIAVYALHCTLPGQKLKSFAPLIFIIEKNSSHNKSFRKIAYICKLKVYM